MSKVKDPKTDNAIIREPEAAGTPIERKDPAGKDSGEAPTNPKTSGAAKPEPDAQRNPVANRNAEAPRQAGVTPRPTEKPIG